jgi:hypothetical protein
MLKSRVGVTFNTILRKAYARGRLPSRFLAFFALPILFFAPSLLGVIRTSGEYLYSGLAYGTGGRLLPGQPTIDPNYGFTSQALGVGPRRICFLASCRYGIHTRSSALRC